MPATRLTARHLAENPPDEKDLNPAFYGRFDYPHEDRLKAEWLKAAASLNAMFKTEDAGRAQ